MPLSEQLADYVRACFTGIWIQSHEHEDALRDIARLCHEENWRLATWGHRPRAAPSRPTTRLGCCVGKRSARRNSCVELAGRRRHVGSARATKLSSAVELGRGCAGVGSSDRIRQAEPDLRRRVVGDRASASRVGEVVCGPRPRLAEPRATRTDRARHRVRRQRTADRLGAANGARCRFRFDPLRGRGGIQSLRRAAWPDHQ